MLNIKKPVLARAITAENKAIKAAEQKAEAEAKRAEELEKKLKEKNQKPAVNTDTGKVNVIVRSNVRSASRKPFVLRFLGGLINTVIVSAILTTIALVIYQYVARPTWGIDLGNLPPVLEAWTDTVVTAFNWLFDRLKEIFAGISNTNNTIDTINNNI